MVTFTGPPLDQELVIRALPSWNWTTAPTRRTPTCSSGSATSPQTAERTTSPTACGGGLPPRARSPSNDPCFHRVAAGHRIALLVAGGAHRRFLRNNGTGQPPADAIGLVPVIHRIQGGLLTLPVTERG